LSNPKRKCVAQSEVKGVLHQAWLKFYLIQQEGEDMDLTASVFATENENVS